jgi:hypothetical protein
MFKLREEFTAPLPIFKSSVPVKKKRYWEQITYIFVHGASANYSRRKKKRARAVCALGKCVPTCQEKKDGARKLRKAFIGWETGGLF